jgi:hypothetical protein
MVFWLINDNGLFFSRDLLPREELNLIRLIKGNEWLFRRSNQKQKQTDNKHYYAYDAKE